MKLYIGIFLVALPLVAMIIATVKSMGFWTTLAIWALAIIGAFCLIAGIYLIIAYFAP